MEYLIVFAFICVGIWLFTKSKQDRIVKPRIVTPPTQRAATPIGLRRRRRDGGFYPVDYEGEYYDDEELVDALLYAAEITIADAMIDEMVDERGALVLEDEVVDVVVDEPVVETFDPAPVVEPVRVVASNFGSDEPDTSWGSDSDSGSDDSGSDDSGSDD